jgi:hypothetical protein
MPDSGIAFVGAAVCEHDAHMFFIALEQIMCIEKFVRHVSFGFASFAVIASVGFAFEYLPVINALAR